MAPCTSTSWPPPPCWSTSSRSTPTSPRWARAGPAGACVPTSRRSSRPPWPADWPRPAIRAFCCATVREMEGMAAAGLGDDLLLANEVLDARRLGRAGRGRRRGSPWPSTPPETIEAAAAGGVQRGAHRRERRAPPLRVPARRRRPTRPTWPGPRASRCAASWATRATSSASRTAPQRETGVAESMALLLAAHDAVGGDVVSGGGTGTWDSTTGSPSSRPARTC